MDKSRFSVYNEVCFYPEIQKKNKLICIAYYKTSRSVAIDLAIHRELK